MSGHIWHIYDILVDCVLCWQITGSSTESHLLLESPLLCHTRGRVWLLLPECDSCQVTLESCESLVGGTGKSIHLKLHFLLQRSFLLSVLWRCWLGIRKSIWPVKNRVMSCSWLFIGTKLQMICIWSSWCHCQPVISCFIKIQNGLTFLVPAYSGCPGKQASK